MYSRISKKKDTKLPNLSKSKSFQTKATFEQIQKLKMEIQQMQMETVQIKSKTSRMRQILSERNAAIRQVFKESNENQKLKTASDSTLTQLQENINALQNTLEARRQDLEDIRMSDRLAMSDELQTELQMYYLEHQRLLKQSKAVKEGEDVVKSELDRLKYELSEKKNHSKNSASIQNDIDDIISKLVAYRRSALKIEASDLTQLLVSNPKLVNTKEKQINEEINYYVNEAARVRNETKQIQEDDEKTYSELKDIIVNQVTRIQDALSRIREQENRYSLEDNDYNSNNFDNQKSTGDTNEANNSFGGTFHTEPHKSIDPGI